MNSTTLVKLDELENHPNLYVRSIQKFIASDGNVVEAWIYLLRKYKPEMLQLEFLESYDSEGTHGNKYVARYLRDSTLVKPDNIMD